MCKMGDTCIPLKVEDLRNSKKFFLTKIKRKETDIKTKCLSTDLTKLEQIVVFS